ncbi:TnsD family transposase [Paenibacillus sp. KN14-4R]|uniref:TnsD family transposase n=1 Tax=Paenibacillus sp. KN14-4R TaxID=3445773 RepID=UPI003FA05D5D
MIYFPSLFPDEILYSALSRYHRDSGSENYKLTMDDLFGDAKVCASLLFPSHLAALCERMPPGSKFNPEKLIANHTFLPYYAPFIPKKRNLEMKEIMNSEKGTSAYMQIGKPASTVKSQQGLNYCSACVIHDRKIYGEAYWHRSHQAEGIFICHYHNNALIRSNVSHANQRNKHEFVSLESILGDEVLHYCDSIQTQSFKIRKYIAEQTYLLLNNPFNPLGLDKINRFYVTKLQRIGLANHSGRIRWADLIPAFNRFFGIELLMELQSHIEPSQEATWLHKLLRKPRVTCHPLRHLLVLGFLGETMESMTNQILDYKISYEPFGKGPWPCLNKAVNHYKDLVISACEITRCSKTGQPVGTFSCSCGFVYSRKGPDQSNNDRFKIGRIKNFGQEWNEKLRIISQQDISLREMSRKLGCDPKTVISRLSDSKKVISSAVDQESMRYKEDWVKLISNNGALSVTELRKLNEAAYSWLYRHDRKWLHEHSPVNKKSIINRERIKWEERDHQTAKEIQLTANEILYGKSDKLIRVTKTEIGRRIGKLPLLFKMLHKLPETAKQLNTVLESVEEFQKRRIVLKAVELKNTNTIIKSWELIRASGLREKFIGIHRDVIDDLIAT